MWTIQNTAVIHTIQKSAFFPANMMLRQTKTKPERKTRDNQISRYNFIFQNVNKTGQELHLSKVFLKGTIILRIVCTPLRTAIQW